MLIASFFVCCLVCVFVPITNPRCCFPTVKLRGTRRDAFCTINSCFGRRRRLLPNPKCRRNFFCGLIRNSRRIKRHPATTFPDSRMNVSAVLVVVTKHKDG